MAIIVVQNNSYCGSKSVILVQVLYKSWLLWYTSQLLWYECCTKVGYCGTKVVIVVHLGRSEVHFVCLDLVYKIFILSLPQFIFPLPKYKSEFLCSQSAVFLKKG